MLLTSGIFAGGTGLGVIAIIALVAVVALILLSRLIRRDPDVRSTKFGWYVERERYSDEAPWPHLRPPENRAIPTWPDRDETKELPRDPPAA